MQLHTQLNPTQLYL